MTWKNTGGGYGSNSGDQLFNSPANLTITADDTVYIASAHEFIQQFDANGNFIRKWGSKGSGDGQFDGLADLSVAPDGRIFVTDRGNDRIQQFSLQGDFIRTWESKGSKDGQLYYPNGVAVASDGSVYVTDYNNHRIQQYNAVGDFLQVIGRFGSGNGQFNFPKDIAISVEGNLYIVDSWNDRIQQISAKGDFIRKWGSLGSDDGQFDDPQGLAIDSDGSIYVADTNNHRIQKFSAEGKFIQAWGSKGSGELQFSSPSDLAIAPDNTIYIADSGNGRIQQLRADGVFIREWGSQGSANGQFRFPDGIAISHEGNVYVADSGNNRIQQFSADGEFVLKWGSKGSGDGQLNAPANLAISPEGDIYIADTESNRIEKIVPRTITNIVSTKPENVAITHPYKGIILAGGGEKIGGRINHIWDGTWRITQKAYKALGRQAFNIHKEIKFLTAGSTEFDLDNNNKFDDLESASKESLRLAITEWAADAKDVVIFLANHGGPGKFQVNGTEVLSGYELNQWVSQLDDSIPGTVTVIIEACNSASFFDPLSKAKRNLFASAKANQAAVISNNGFSSFSYFFWSEIGTGALLRNAFENARQAMSSIIIDGSAQNAQADIDGDQRFTEQELDTLGDYCLGNCNQTAAGAPVIASIKPSSRTLNGETALDFNIKVTHLQVLNRAWALVQRPDDISIDPNQALNFDKIKLSCNSEDICQGRYERFDLAGDYKFSVYAMDVQEEVSLPEMFSVTQTQGNEVIPAVYDDQLAVVYLRDVLVDGQHLQAALELQGGKFVVIAVSEARKQFYPAAEFDFDTGKLIIPHALAFGENYQATFKYLGNLEFQLESAEAK